MPPRKFPQQAMAEPHEPLREDFPGSAPSPSGNSPRLGGPSRGLGPSSVEDFFDPRGEDRLEYEIDLASLHQTGDPRVVRVRRRADDDPDFGVLPSEEDRKLEATLSNLW
jgi:hypothetical protein